MKKSLLIIAAAAAALCLAGCKCNEKKSDSNGLTVLTVTEPTLTEVAAEQYDITKLAKDENGAYIIWNGENFDGWRGTLTDHVPSKWVIQDGALRFLGRTEEGQGKEGGDLIFAYQFKNFELDFDWMVTKGANSGVFYLVKEYQSGDEFYSSPITCPEYQILDNVNHKDAKYGRDGNRQSASLYDMIPAKPQNSNPWGEWNSGKIVVNNGNVEHWQNGVKVVEYTLWTADWEARLRDCKWAPRFNPIAFVCQLNMGGNSHSGYIGFQDHGDEVFFKNMRVKVLD